MAVGKKEGKKRRKNVVIGATGRVYIQASFNNLIVSVTNQTGEVISWSSAGKMGFRGAKKSTPYAAQICYRSLCKRSV